MKALSRFILAACLASAATGCESFLDVNDNPNQATAVSANSILASALTTTAANYTGGVNAGQNYNSYSSFVAGFWSKSGTVSGFSEERTYNYSSNYYGNLFNATYDNLNDYNLIQQQADAYPRHAAIARIMKVYNYQLLVDQYGDVPYTNALQGITNVAPTYDSAPAIYRDLVVQLKGAIADINAAVSAGSTAVGADEDVVFRGDMTKWKQFANSLRLRVLLRESSVDNAYVRTEMAALQQEPDGFITTDVVVQPGYAANSGQQNPFYNRYGFAAGATRATSEYSFVIPTNYIIAQYELNSDPRITQLYRVGRRYANGTSGAVVAGYLGGDLGAANYPTFTTNATNDNPIGSRFLQGGTFLRSASAPTVLMLLSEQLFSKAEAESNNMFTGGNDAAKLDFQNGIKAAFLYTYRTTTDLTTILSGTGSGGTPITATSTTPGIEQYNRYVAANATNGLVSWEANATMVPNGTNANFTTLLTTPRTVSTLEKIIYQKYLASNTVASTEAWDNYRRTALPKFKYSIQSASPRADKLPTRLIYPQSEVSTNQASIPAGTTQYTKIFWDVVD